MTEPSAGPPDDRPGTPSKQHGDPLLASAQGRGDGDDGSRQGPSHPEGAEPPIDERG